MKRLSGDEYNKRANQIATSLFIRQYPEREKRFLQSLKMDCEKWTEKSFLLHEVKGDLKNLIELSADNKSIARKTENYFDFLVFFDYLREKMSEFRWSSDFLLQNGINFKEIRRLYFAVA